MKKQNIIKEKSYAFAFVETQCLRLIAKIEVQCLCLSYHENKNTMFASHHETKTQYLQ